MVTACCSASAGAQSSSDAVSASSELARHGIRLAQRFDGFALDGEPAPVPREEFGKAAHVLRVRRHGPANAARNARVEVVRQWKPASTLERIRSEQRHTPRAPLACGAGNADRHAERRRHHALPDVTHLEEAAMTTQLVNHDTLALGEDV